MEKYLKYITLGIIGILLLSFPFSVPVIKSFCPYSIFNTNWNGCSEFAKMIHHRGKLIPILSPYDSYSINEGVLFIISPDIHYSNSDIEKIKNFLNNGGVLVIADDFGYSNDILDGLNISSKISRRRTFDLFYYKNYSLIQTYKVENFNGKLTFNIPSYLLSNNGEIKSSKKVLMKKIKYGNGEVIVISDSDIFINGMKNYNEKFWEFFLNNLNANIYYIDEVHHSSFSPYDIGVTYLHSNLTNNQKFIIFSIIVIGTFILENINLLKVVKFKKKTSLEDIAEKHDINLEDLNRIISKIEKGKNY